MNNILRRWESKRRYFEVRIFEDLFGQRILETRYGGLRSRLGMIRVVAVGEGIPSALKEIEQRRSRHGYAELCLLARHRPAAQVRKSGRVAHSN